MTNTTLTRNTLAYTSDIYWTRNGTTLYPTTSGDSVLPNGTAYLGSDTSRWADLFLSSSTLHLGSSTTDEGIISYDTTNNIFKFDTDSTTNGDISFFTDDLYLDKSTGRVGVGTSTPSYGLEVNSGVKNYVAMFQYTGDLAKVNIRDEDTVGFLSAQNGKISLGYEDEEDFLDVSLQGRGAHGVTFSTDGSKVYVVNYQYPVSKIFQYNLSVNWEINTAVYSNKSYTVSPRSVQSSSVAFNSDGTKMYVSDFATDTIYQYGLTGWDISTSSYESKSFSVASQELDIQGIEFSLDGSQMYIVGVSNDTVYQYVLATEWDISTASYTGKSLNVSSEENQPQSVSFTVDGINMYISGYAGKDITQYTLSSPWDVSTGSYTGKSLPIHRIVAYVRGADISPDGSKLYIAENFSSAIYQSNLSTPGDLSTATTYEVKSFNTSAQAANVKELTFNSIGDKMYTIGGYQPTVYQYGLSTNWDKSTAFYSGKNYPVYSICSNPRGLNINSDGDKMYIVDNTTLAVYQFSLSISGDISSASYTGNSFSVSGQMSQLTGLGLNSDGTKLYVSASDFKIFEYTLSIPWDISSASYLGSFLTLSTGVHYYTNGMEFSNDGTKVYIPSPADIAIYTLSTPWDITSGTYSSVKTVAGQTQQPRGLSFNDIGNKLFLLDEKSNVISYTLDTPWDVTTAVYDNISYKQIVIDSSGYLGIGTSTPTQALDVLGSGRFSAVGSGTYASALNITSDGTLTTSTSDARLKTNIENIDSALEKVLQLRGVYFNWKEDENGQRMTGMIAQEVMEVMPELVFMNKVDGYYGINYGEATGLLIEAIKEQQKQIEALSLIYDSENLDEFILQMNASKVLKLTLNEEGNIELLGGEVLLAGDGTLSIRKLRVVQDYSIGSGKILAGQTKVVINTQAVTEQSKFFINPTSDSNNQVLYVTDIKVGESFTVNIKQALEQDITFDWFIVDSWLSNVKGIQESETPTEEEVVEETPIIEEEEAPIQEGQPEEETTIPTEEPLEETPIQEEQPEEETPAIPEEEEPTSQTETPPESPG